MKFIFWQSILSIHQVSFLNALSKEHDVILVVERETDDVRKQSGWVNPTFGCNQIIIAPDVKIFSELISDTKDAIHVISGLEMTFQNYKLTQKITNLNYKVICYLEPFKWFGLKGMARLLKYSILRNKYGKSISAMLPTGKLGVKLYETIGFKNVYEWGYFTEGPIREEKRTFTNQNTKPKILFVGSLDKRKNILSLIKVMSEADYKEIQLSIVGDGPLRHDVINLSSHNSNISYLGVKPNDKVKEIMSQHDILVLPSIFDGWGAVVNEALSAGMRVICSDRCGSATLLQDKWRGCVFSFDRKGDLKRKLSEQIKLGIQTCEQRERVKEWCKNHISGQIASEYFINICQYLFEREKYHKPLVPWED